MHCDASKTETLEMELYFDLLRTYQKFLIDAFNLAAKSVEIGDLGQETFQTSLHLVHAVQHGVKIIGFFGDATQTALDRFQ